MVTWGERGASRGSWNKTERYSLVNCSGSMLVTFVVESFLIVYIHHYYCYPYNIGNLHYWVRKFVRWYERLSIFQCSLVVRVGLSVLFVLFKNFRVIRRLVCFFGFIWFEVIHYLVSLLSASTRVGDNFVSLSLWNGIYPCQPENWHLWTSPRPLESRLRSVLKDENDPYPTVVGSTFLGTHLDVSFP